MHVFRDNLRHFPSMVIPVRIITAKMLQNFINVSLKSIGIPGTTWYFNNEANDKFWWITKIYVLSNAPL